MKKIFSLLAVATMMLWGGMVKAQTKTYSGEFPFSLETFADQYTNPVAAGWAGTTRAPSSADRTSCVTRALSNMNSERNIIYRLPHVGSITIQLENSTAGRGVIVTNNKGVTIQSGGVANNCMVRDGATCYTKTFDVNYDGSDGPIDITITSPAAAEGCITVVGSVYLVSVSFTAGIAENPNVITSVAVDAEQDYIVRGNTLQMTETVLPAGAEDKSVVWSVADKVGANVSSAFVSIDLATGLLTATADAVDGEVTVTATSSKGAEGADVVGTKDITVVATEVVVASVAITNPEPISVVRKATLQMTADVSPSNATNPTITWSVINGTGEATINAETGLLTATKTGMVRVAVISEANEAAVDTVDVEITALLVTGISEIKGLKTATVGATRSYAAIISPSDADTLTVTWSVDDPALATFSGNVLTAKAEGKVEIKATSHNGKVKTDTVEIGAAAGELLLMDFDAYAGALTASSATTSGSYSENGYTLSIEKTAAAIAIDHEDRSALNECSRGALRFANSGGVAGLNVTLTTDVLPSLGKMNVWFTSASTNTGNNSAFVAEYVTLLDGEEVVTFLDSLNIFGSNPAVCFSIDNKTKVATKPGKLRIRMVRPSSAGAGLRIQQLYVEKAADNAAAPTLTFNPAEGATGAAYLQPTFTISADKLLYSAAGTPLVDGDLVSPLITLTKVEGSEAVPFTAELRDHGAQIAVSPTSNLLPNTQYTLSLAAVKDEYGNATEAKSATFTTETADDVAPTRVAVFPADGASNIPINTVITISYSERVKVANEAGITINTIAIDSARVVADTAVQIFAKLVKNTPYTVALAAGAVQDLASNNAAETSWSFTTDGEAPALNGSSPENGATVAINVKPTFTFSEKVKIATASLPNAINGSIGATLSMGEGDTVVMAVADAALAYETQYTLTIPAGSITDISGNEYAQELVLNFTTKKEVVGEFYADFASTPAGIAALAPAAGTGATNSTWATNPITIDGMTFGGNTDHRLSDCVIADVTAENTTPYFEATDGRLGLNGANRYIELPKVKGPNMLYFYHAPSGDNNGTRGIDLTANGTKFGKDTNLSPNIPTVAGNKVYRVDSVLWTESDSVVYRLTATGGMYIYDILVRSVTPDTEAPVLTFIPANGASEVPTNTVFKAVANKPLFRKDDKTVRLTNSDMTNYVTVSKDGVPFTAGLSITLDNDTIKVSSSARWEGGSTYSVSVDTVSNDWGYKSGVQAASFTIRNEVLATGIEISGLTDEQDVTVGQTVTLSAEVTPSNATDLSVTWTLEDGEEFATLNAAAPSVTATAASGSTPVRIRATANGGTNLYDEVEFYVVGGGGTIVAKNAAEYGIVVSPNPTDGVLNVKSDVVLKQVKVFSVSSGTLMQSQLFSGASIDLSALAAGSYIVLLFPETGAPAAVQVVKQ